MDILLIGVLIILGGFSLHGYIRGMVRVIYSLVAIFLTIGLSSFITPYTEDFLRTQTPLYNTVYEKCSDMIQLKIEKESEDTTQKQENITIFGIEIPYEIQEFFSKEMVGEAGNFIENSGIYQQVAEQVAEVALQKIAWIISFIIVIIVLGIFIHVLDIISRLPGINSINHMGGLIVGFIQGLIIIWILFFVITLCQASVWGNQLMLSIHKNVFLKMLYDNNLIEELILQIIK